MRGLSSLYGLGVLRRMRCPLSCLEKSDKQPCEKKRKQGKQKRETLKNRVMKEEIKQNGKVLLSGNDGVSVPVIFRNLCGRNFSGNEYRNYLASVIREFGVSAGRI